MDTLLTFGIFCLIGGIFLSIGLVFLYFTIKYLRNGIKIEAKVVGIYQGRAKVEYQIGGRKYEFLGTVSSSPPAYKIGDKINVIYLKNNHSKVRIYDFSTFWLFPISFGGVGLFILLMGLISLFIDIKRDEIEKLNRDGIVIESRFKDVLVEDNSYQIVTTYQDFKSKKIYTFKSKKLNFNPLYCIKRDFINVKVLPNNYKIYRMDINFIKREKCKTKDKNENSSKWSRDGEKR